MKSGVYKYSEAPDFEVLLFAYSFNGGDVRVVDVASEMHGELYDNMRKHLQDPGILKKAFNAAFERTCLAKYFGVTLDPAQWECTMVKASMLGLPLSLDHVAKALKLENQKDATGKALIKYFSMPCKPTKVNGERTRNRPEHAPEKWQAFKDYCVKDVIVEQDISKKIAFFEIPVSEKKLWALDQKINDGGVRLDRTLVKQAIQLDIANKEILTKKAIELTGLDNPNSAAQLKAWLTEEMDEEVKTLRKADIPELLKATDCEIVSAVLKIRQEMSKTSVKKYLAMSRGICADGRMRGIHQMYGANRTGRWAGRLVQPQNLPRNKMKDLDLARQIVREGDLELLTLMFGNVPDTLSQLIRTAFVAAKGNSLLLTDFSAIEARVIAWLANEKWRLDVFAGDGKIYEASAAMMYKIPIEAVTKTSEYRQRGKIAELALGYQGGPNAITSMEITNLVPVEKRLPLDERVVIVDLWRKANRSIVRLWYAVQDAALKAVSTSTPVQIMHGIRFSVEKNILFIELPSKRRLAYLRPAIKSNRFGNDSLHYEGVNPDTKQWGFQETYGGKLVENIVQAIARDCLAEAMMRMDDAGYKIVMHVHDEIVIEAPKGTASMEEINKIMGMPMPWGKGLPLNGEGYETPYYKKD